MSTDDSGNKSVVTPANDSARIETIIAWLEARGWTVDRFCYALTPYTAEVDYKNKTMRMNISSAYYAATALERVKDNLEVKGVTVIGGYLYVFAGGEKKRYDDGGSTYRHMALAIHEVDLPGPQPTLTADPKDPA